jgi:hypothetical protein
VQLSIFSGRQSRYPSIEDLDRAVESCDALSVRDLAELRTELLKSNWGPLVVAVEHHRDRLRIVWVLCTKGGQGSARQFPSVKRLIGLLCGREVSCEAVEVGNANDIGETAAAVQRVYRDQVPDADLDPEDVIADFTGGTAAMSGGMVLATLHWERRLEYLSQEIPLVDQHGRALTEKEIQDKRVLIAVTTTPEMAAEGLLSR